MGCYNCGNEIDEDINICPYCKIKNVYIAKKKNKKREINLFFKIFIISLFLIVFLIIFLKVYFNYDNSKNILINNEGFVNLYCAGDSYISGVLVSDFIDNYNCSKFASYMLDTSGKDLSRHHFEYLISLSDKNIYEIYTAVTGEYMNSIYDEEIMDATYYDFLYEKNNMDKVEPHTYTKVIYNSYKEDNFELFKSALRNFNSEIVNSDYVKKKYLLDDYYDDDTAEFSDSDFEYVKKYQYAPNYIYLLEDIFGLRLTEDNINEIKTVALTREKYIIEYQKYTNEFYCASIFNENLMKLIPGERFYNTFVFDQMEQSSYIVSLDDLKKYRSWGGKFYYKQQSSNSYKKNSEILSNYISYMIYDSEKFDKNDEIKFKYLLNEAKKDGFEIKYSDTMDLFLDKLKYRTVESFARKDNYSVSDHKYKVRKIYKMLINEGFESYTNLDYIESEDNYGLRYL